VSFSATQQFPSLSFLQRQACWILKKFYFVKNKNNFLKNMCSTYSKDPKKAGKLQKHWRSVEDQHHALPPLAVLYAVKVN